MDVSRTARKTVANAHGRARARASQRSLACSHKLSRSITTSGTKQDLIFLLQFEPHWVRAESVLARRYRFMYRALRRASARVFSSRSARKSSQLGPAVCVTQRETDVPLAAIPMDPLWSSGRGALSRGGTQLQAAQGPALPLVAKVVEAHVVEAHVFTAGKLVPADVWATETTIAFLLWALDRLRCVLRCRGRGPHRGRGGRGSGGCGGGCGLHGAWVV